jgi:two-component system NtrC family sensor kinase
LLVATLVTTARLAPAWYWWAGLAVPLTAGMLSVYAFRPHPLARWCSRGYLLAADGLLVGMALYGSASRRPLILAGYFAVVLVAVVVGDRTKTVLASGALLGLAGAAHAAGIVPGTYGLTLLGWYPVLLIAAAFSFGALAQCLGRPEHGDLSRRARDETSEQWALLDITETIGSTLDVGQVMRSIVRQVGDLMNVESCSILLADEKQSDCFVIASKGHPEIDMLEVDLGDYPEVRRALETREPVVIKNVESSPLVASVRDVLVEKGYRALLVVPLVYGKEVLGALFLRTRREDPFTADEIRFCKLAAGASANALKNAMLYRDVAAESENHRVTGEKLRRVLDGTPDMIVAADNGGRITEFNRGAEKLTGWSVTRAIGRRLSEILGPDFEDGPEGSDDEAARFRDVVYPRYDGASFEISLASAPLRDAAGEVAGRVWIGRDVTQLRRVEKSLAQAERLSSLGEVVAGVAHELNNPLSGVVGYAELLRMHATADQQIRDLERIVESAMRCQKIVLKLLSFARQHPPEKKNHDLNECVRKVLDLKSYHLRSSRIETRLELDHDLPTTCFDFHQIEQVILNLLNNADQAIGSLKTAGTIVLRTGVTSEGLFVQVEDNGPGVPRAIRDRIFDPFFTTKDLGQGTGLGLAVSYGIVKEHGGRIEVGPGSGNGGAVFTIWLPIVEAKVETEHEPRPVAAREGNLLTGRRILVVEDEPVVLELLSRVLSDDGAEVTLAHDGVEALESLASNEYDLIVADLRMPNLDGRQLYERIAEQRPDMLRRFVFATGDLLRQETVTFLENLPNRILTKPLEVETVRRVLSQALDSTPN